MKFLKFSLTIFLILIEFNFSKAQTVEQTIQFADSCYNVGGYELALKSYKRAYYFLKDKNNSELNCKIADCLFMENKFMEASKFYETALFSTNSDSIWLILEYKKIDCFIFSKNYYNAISEIYSFPKKMLLEVEKKNKFLLAICYFGIEDFEKSKQFFIEALPDSSLQIEIINAFGSKKYLKRPNPNLFAFFSVLAPGSGQYFLGDFKNGINSQILLGTLVFIGIKISLIYSPFDGIITILPWFTRYYKGNIQRSKKNANLKNSLKKELVYKKVLTVFDNSKKK